MGKRKEAAAPLTRWQYFFKTLYYNAADTTEFTYNRVIYAKSAALQAIDQRNTKIQYVLILLLILMFLLTAKYRNVWFVLVYFVAVIVGETVRYFLLPRDMRAHLTDTGRRAR